MRNRKIIVTQWEVTQRSNDVYGNAEPRGWTIGIYWKDDSNCCYLYGEKTVLKSDDIFGFRKNRERLSKSIENLKKSFMMDIRSSSLDYLSNKIGYDSKRNYQNKILN